MCPDTHQSLVSDQFSAAAAAYVTSPVHATGEDLAQIASAMRDLNPARVLDLGCGGGHASFAAAPHAGEVVAYDLSADMLAAVKVEGARRSLPNIATRQGAAESLPFADASFDAVLTRMSAHHWSDIGAGLREARRVLKPGGRAIFIDVTAPDHPGVDTWFQTMELLRDPSHVLNYSHAEWMRHLAAARFRIDALTPRRLRLDFASWIARLATPPVHVQALRALHARVPAEIAAYFELEPDGSFTIDTLTIEAHAGV
jgi:ubiquinone/menaquinone biosynthesis C-methylase UbiE